MSKSIKGTQTEKNLLTSFAGESTMMKIVMMTAVRQYMVFAHHETYQGGEMIMVSFFISE